MIPEENSLILFKIGERQWIKKIQEGEISFACLGRYIDIAKKTGNIEQGDPDEGVFARLKKGDSRISQVSEQLLDDLEIIDDGDYVKLRRKSSYFIPIFCLYSYRGIDVLNNEIEKPGVQTVFHYFDENMYGGFSQDTVRNVLSFGSSQTTLIMQVLPFQCLLARALAKKGVDYEIRHINYEEFEKDEFFIEPTEERNELFYKFPRYSSQKEVRVRLSNSSNNDIYDRVNLKIGSFPNGDTYLHPGKLFMGLNVDIEETRL